MTITKLQLSTAFCCAGLCHSCTDSAAEPRYIRRDSVAQAIPPPPNTPALEERCPVHTSQLQAREAGRGPLRPCASPSACVRRARPSGALYGVPLVLQREGWS